MYIWENVTWEVALGKCVWDSTKHHLWECKGLVSIKDDWSMKDNKGSDTLQKFVISKSFYSNEKTQWEWLRSILDSKIVRHIPCWTLNTPGVNVDKYEHGTKRIREEKNHRRITKKVTNKTLKTSCERKNVFQEELFSSGWKQNLFKIWSTGWKQNITEKN